MSNTKTVAAKPYFNMAVEEQMTDNEQVNSGDQNPNTDTNDGSDSAGPNTQTGNTPATSDGKEDETYKERWVNLKRYHDTSIHEARKQIKDLELKLQSSATAITPPTNAEELEKFKQENPDLYKSLEMQLTPAESAVSVDKYQEMQDELIKTRQERALDQIKAAHPDMVDLIADASFNEWVEAQSAAVQGMIKDNSEDATAFIRGLDLYKLDKGITSSVKGTSDVKSVSDASAADAVTVTGASAEVGEVNGRIWTRDEIRKLSPREFEMFEQDLEAAQREGRIVN